MEDARIVLYPAPGISHLVSMIELGKLILPRFSVTILLATGPFDTPATTSYIDRISHTHPSISFLRFPCLSLDAAASSSSSTGSVFGRLFEFIRRNDSNVRRALQQLSQASTVRAFIIDYFCGSALAVARDLGIPTFHFLTSGAASVAAVLHFPAVHREMESNSSTRGKSFKDMPGTLLHFPGCPPLQASRMLQPLLIRDDSAYHDMLYLSEILPKSDGLLINTFDDLEPIAIRAIREGKCVPDCPTPPIYCVGPLIAGGGGGDQDDRENNIISSWLDRQPTQSVVFLCFGSKGTFSSEQVKEIANGLERSGQRFLWVVKSPAPSTTSSDADDVVDLDGLMPEGFLERTKDRGMVVKSWAPHVAVLNHPAMGGFVTHCGWNSVLEAVVAGVPMVAWPLYAEQHLNMAALVEDMRMGIGIEQRDDEDMFVSGEEVERRVRELMEKEEGRKLRERSRKMKEMAMAACREDGGSSTAALAKLARLWSQDVSDGRRRTC